MGERVRPSRLPEKSASRSIASAATVADSVESVDFCAADADGVGSQPAIVIIEDPMANHSKILLFMLPLLTSYWVWNCGSFARERRS